MIFGIGNIIFFMPYKRSKTPDNKTFFFLISKVTLKTRILPSQPQETPESLSCLIALLVLTLKLQNCLIIFFGGLKLLIPNKVKLH